MEFGKRNKVIININFAKRIVLGLEFTLLKYAYFKVLGYGTDFVYKENTSILIDKNVLVAFADSE